MKILESHNPVLRIRVPDFRINTFKSFKVMPDTPAPGSSTKPTTPFNIHEYVATFFLPDSMLDYFDMYSSQRISAHR